MKNEIVELSFNFALNIIELYKFLKNNNEFEDGRWKMEDGRWKMEDGRWKMEDGRWKMEDGRWKTNMFFFNLTFLISNNV